MSKTIAKKIGLALVSSLMTLLLVEVALRFLWSNPYAGTKADYVIKLRLNHPLVDHRRVNRSEIDSNEPFVRYRQDGRGYTVPSFRFDDPDFTVAFLGGSTTECIAVTEDQRFPALVSTRLEEKGLRVNTLNGGRSGSTLHDSVNVLFNHVIQDTPDVVVVMHACNDLGLLHRYGNYNTRMGQHVGLADVGKYSLQMLSSRMALAGALRNVVAHGDFRRRAFDLSPGKQNMRSDTAPFRDRLCVFVDMCRAFAITPILMTQPGANAVQNELTPHWVDHSMQHQFNSVTREVGRTKGVFVIDLSAEIATKTEANGLEEATKIFYDGSHVTDYGSQLYADHITERLFVLFQSTNGLDPHVP